MRKKSGFTIVEQAIVLVPDFERVVRKLEQQVTLRGQSKSTVQNYIRRINLLVLHFGKLSEAVLSIWFTDCATITGYWG
ncbi:MAG: hypothetical protein V2B15_16720 [Bacteroidota bacterium]